MRTLRVVLAGIATILVSGLVAGSMVALAAEDEDPMAPAWVTGTIAVEGNDLGGDTAVEPPATITEGVGYRLGWEASDPRLSGAGTYTGNWKRYLRSRGMQVQAASFVLGNDDGRWVGTSTALVGPEFDSDALTLHGEGAYEGLTAYVVVDFVSRPATFNAAIFPGGMPTPPEPRAE